MLEDIGKIFENSRWQLCGLVEWRGWLGVRCENLRQLQESLENFNLSCPKFQRSAVLDAILNQPRID